MHYQNSTWIPLNRITNRDGEMESLKEVKDITIIHPLAAALRGQRLVKNLQKEKGTLQLIQCNCLQPFCFIFFKQYIKNQAEHSQRKNMWSCIQLSLAKCPIFLRVSPSLKTLVFMSPSAHFTLSHEVDVVDTVCQLRILVN